MTESAAEQTVLNQLIQLGFEPVTEWVVTADKLRPASLEWQDHGGWLYAFVVDTDVKYIGLTERVLRSRLDNYRHQNDVSQNQRIRIHILNELLAGKRVHVYGLKQRDPAVLKAEEARLRAVYKPAWNRA